MVEYINGEFRNVIFEESRDIKFQNGVNILVAKELGGCSYETFDFHGNTKIVGFGIDNTAQIVAYARKNFGAEGVIMCDRSSYGGTHKNKEFGATFTPVGDGETTSVMLVFGGLPILASQFSIPYSDYRSLQKEVDRCLNMI